MERAAGNTHILIRTREFVEDLYDLQLPGSIRFHTIEHTRQVVKAVNIICVAQGVGFEDREILQIAGWFHDTGFIHNYQNHEQMSIEIAQHCLRAWNYPEEKIRKVSACIRATRIPQNPENELEKIICDADMYHLSDENYWHVNLKLKEEISSQKEYIPDSKWYLNNLSFLINHSYFTEYGKQVLEDLKQKNIDLNIQKLEKLIHLYE